MFISNCVDVLQFYTPDNQTCFIDSVSLFGIDVGIFALVLRLHLTNQI